MPKLAIYVPKKDMREIEKWRKKINFSRVFMQALRREIADRSRFVEAREEQVAVAAAYYRRRLMEDSARLVDIGYRLGSRHVMDCRLAPETIRRLLEIDDLETAQPEDLVAVEQALGKGIDEVNQLARQHGFDEASHPAWRLAVYRGYLTGVAAAWKRVCEYMQRTSEPCKRETPQ
ncbi:MAG: hypothetical protein A2W31_15035 [Planctomycetes bacterium RBG_16_64_10]|nr:MAG: hypothetical protein A2W31_15035 [Planctomycetes bacterium RBG_16_64_10]